MTIDLSRRAVLQTGALGSLLALAGCGTSTGGSSALSKDPVSLRLYWWGAALRNDLTLKTVKAFEADEERVSVKGQFVDWSGYWDKLATTVAAGDAPDVIQMDANYLASYADRGALLDLGQQSKQLDTSALAKPVLQTGESKGTLYAMPIGVTAGGMLVNTDVFSRLGIELPDTTTWTWDELGELTQEISSKSGGAVRGWSPFGGDVFSLTLWARQHGSEVFEDGNLVLEPEVLRGYWGYVQDSVKNGGAPSASELSEGASKTLDQGDLAIGKTAMGFIPNTLIVPIAAAADGATMVLADMPVPAAGTKPYQYLKPSMYWSVSSKAQHPAEAAQLVDFLVNDPEAGKILGTERGVPSNPKIQQLVKGSLDPVGRQALDYVDAVSKKLGKAPAIPPNGASDIEATMVRYNQSILSGQQSLDDAVKGFVKEMDSSIASA